MTDEATEEGVSEEKFDDSRANMIEILAEQKQAMEESPEDQEVDEEEEQAVVEEPEEEFEEITVDGAKQKVSKKDIYEAGIRAKQKESTADKRLEEATRILKESKEEAEKNKQPSRPDVAETESQVKETIERIQMGTPEEAHKALETLIASNQKPSMTKEEIDAYVVQQMEAKTQQQTIISKFKESYSNLYDDPRLREITAKEVDRLVNDGADYEWDTYQKAAESINEWLGAKKPDKGLEDRTEKKRSVVSIKGSGAKKTVQAEEKTETTQDVLADMRKARGQIL